MSRRLCRICLAPALLVLLPLLGTTSAQAGANSDVRLSHDQWHKVIDIVQSDPDSFAGVTADVVSGVATVYTTEQSNGSPKSLQALQNIGRVAASPRGGAAAIWSLRFESRPHSLAELNGAMDLATNDPHWRALAGPYLAQWYVDPQLNAVSIGLTSIPRDLATAAVGVFGDLARLVIAERMSPTANRTNNTDAPPWWGGDGIIVYTTGNVGYEQCTESFPVTRNSDSRQAVLTAGHCDLAGYHVYEAWNAYKCMGAVTTRVNGGGSYDFAFVDTTQLCGTGNSYVLGSIQGRIYYSGTLTRAIGGSAHAYVGDQACFDGAVTQENCSGYVSGSDDCYIYSNGLTYCHMARASSNTLTVLARSGDSGGPVYEISGGKVYAQGIISAALPSSGGITAVFTPMWRVLQDYGYSMVKCLC